MKTHLLFLSLAIFLFSACDENPTTKMQSSLHTNTDLLSTTVIEEEIDDCNKAIAKYDNLINKTLSGDVEAMKKLSPVKEKIEERWKT